MEYRGRRRLCQVRKPLKNYQFAGILLAEKFLQRLADSAQQLAQKVASLIGKETLKKRISNIES